jgi:hypothetical protein
MERDTEGSSHIHFGDGQIGHRPGSGSTGISASYRQGVGSQGNVPSKVLEEKLDRVARKLDRFPDSSKRKISKDEGIALVDSVSALSDMLSFYQSSVSNEAHLSTDDRSRISVKEEKIKPKLRSMIDFCDNVDSKTKKKMGLSDSDIRKIRTTATRALQIAELKSGKCSNCGTVNKPGSMHCKNCGAPL